MADNLLGSFVWCELMTTDPPAAESFYKKVVGWKAVPFGPDYTVFNNSLDSGVGGMMKLPAQAGAPPHWIMYLGTPNCDDTTMRIAQLGGRVLRQAQDIPNVGRFAVVQDPYGATFAILEPRPAPGSPAPKRGGTGDFSWFELYTPNPDGAWKFYSTLFGWEKTSAMDMGEMGTYQMFGRGGGIPNGGIMKPPPGTPPAWMPYTRVKDAKAAAATATANGGKIVNGPMEVPGGDWIAQGIDPQGGMFAVHSLKPTVSVKTVAKVATAVAAAVALGAAATVATKRTTKNTKGTNKTAPKKTAARKTVARKTVARKTAAKKTATRKTAKKKAAKKAKKASKRKK